MSIDFHTHIIPSDIPDFKQKFGYGGFITLQDMDDGKMMIKDTGENFRYIKCNCYDAKERLYECDKYNVGKQVLSTVPIMFSYWAKAEHTAEICVFLNDHIADVVKSNPDRFIGLGTLPMNDVLLAIKELDRCILQLGLKGVEIATNINGKNLDDPIFFPLYKRMEQLKIVIFIHPWNMATSDRTNKYWLDWLVGMPFETDIAICSMIFGGIFEKFPNLKVVFSHGGGSFIATLGRIQKGFDVNPSLFPNKCSPRKYLKNIYVDSLVHDQDMLNKLVKELGSDHILYGTDYPFPLGEPYVENSIIKNNNIDENDKQNILWRNAHKLFSDVVTPVKPIRLISAQNLY